MKTLLIILGLVCLPCANWASGPGAVDVDIDSVAPAKLVAAMKSQQGYNVTATTNVARFQAAVLLRLVRDALAENPLGTALFIDHDEWFESYLTSFDLTADSAPLFTKLARENGQDLVVDCRRGNGKAPGQGNELSPILTAYVTVSWPQTPGRPSKYSFEDALSTPRLKVTNHRVVTYRLLDFGDMLVYDQIHGLTGRPTSGVLGLLFKVIGEGRVVQSRIAVTPDGLQINYSHVRKGPFHVKATVTVYPDGKTVKGVPKGRKDLQLVDRRLRRKLITR